eukprot:TRINITY_DN12382_c0_g1_i2.p1 TRINITY_DN12382_c0_g1~~TRINITY_DN12382_c0_g1_i2.p1  ORF type:complete len:357 (-),score=50.51 TRINITY_DN12382_c0_g1_i2:44-1114(-)
MVSGPSLPPNNEPVFLKPSMLNEVRFRVPFKHPDVKPWDARYANGEILDGSDYPEKLAEPPSNGLVPTECLSVHASSECAPHETAAMLLDVAESHDVGPFYTSKWNAHGSEHWIEINVSDAPVTLKRYALRSANDCPRRDPRHWNLFGIGADGIEHLLHTASDVTPWSGRWVWKEFCLEEETAQQPFNKFRMYIIENNGDNCTQLGELRLYSQGACEGSDRVSCVHSAVLKLHFPIDGTEYIFAREKTNESPPCVNGRWHLAEGLQVGEFGSSFIIALPEAVAGLDAVDPFERLYGIVQVQNEIYGYWRREAEQRMTHGNRGMWKAVLHDDGTLEVTVLPSQPPIVFVRQQSCAPP